MTTSNVVKITPKTIYYRYAKKYKVAISFNPETQEYDWSCVVNLLPIRDSAKSVAGAKRMAGRRIESVIAGMNGTSVNH